jgi:hypothetical protein
MNIHNSVFFALSNQCPCCPAIKLIDLIYRGFQLLELVGRTWQKNVYVISSLATAYWCFSSYSLVELGSCWLFLISSLVHPGLLGTKRFCSYCTFVKLQL